MMMSPLYVNDSPNLSVIKSEKITAQFPLYSRTIVSSYYPLGIVMFDQLQELMIHEIANFGR